jgi:hypothetical protein
MTLAIREAASPAAVEEWDKLRAALKRNPLAAAPPALQQPVWRLWATHRHLAGLESPLSIAAAVGVWVREFGLSEQDAAIILRGFLAPGLMGRFRFASDLMTALAGAAEAAIGLRERAAEAERRAAAPDAEPIDRTAAVRVREELRRRLSESFAPPKG